METLLNILPITTTCFHCKTNSTRFWRKIPTGETVCNSCGLFYMAEQMLPRIPSTTMQRPRQQQQQQHLAKEESNPEFSLPSIEDLKLPKPKCSGPTRCNGTGGNEACRGCPTLNQGNYNASGISCSNCSTSSTPLWRRATDGSPLCNACGLYYKLHNKHRPSNLKSPLIKRRRRLPVLPDIPKISTPQLDKYDKTIVSQHIANFGNTLVIKSQDLNSTSLREMIESVGVFHAFLNDSLIKLDHSQGSETNNRPLQLTQMQRPTNPLAVELPKTDGQQLTPKST